MSRAGAPYLLVALALFAGCASIAGIDDLAYDLAGEGRAGVAASSSAGAPTTDASSTTTTGEPTTTSDAASSSSASTADSSSSGGGGGGGSTAGGGGEGGHGGEGGSTPTGFVVTGDRAEYRKLLREYYAAIWHLGEAEGEGFAEDDGSIFYDDQVSDSDYDAEYIDSAGSITFQVPGVFPDDGAVAFAGGARAAVDRGQSESLPYWLDRRYGGSAFALAFFAKLDGVPDEPITVVSCVGDDDDDDDDTVWGWRVMLRDKLIFYENGLGDDLEPTDDEVLSFPFPADGAWHLVVLTQQADDGPVFAYLDGKQKVEQGESLVDLYPLYFGVFSMGAEAGETGAAAVTLDEVAFVADALDQDQVDSLIDCLQGPPGAQCFAASD